MLCAKYESELSSSVNTVMNNCLSYIVGRFLTSSADVSCVKWATNLAVIWGNSYRKIFSYRALHVKGVITQRFGVKMRTAEHTYGL